MIRRAILTGLASLVLCLVVLPALLVRGCAPASAPHPGLRVTVYLVKEGRLVRMGLEDYLTGVVAAEMPARFASEALKAQAVAARTITVRRLRRFGGRGCSHLAAADICDQSADGQAWLSTDGMRRAWGWRYGTYRRKIERAVQETRGLVLLHEHRPIDAAYHSTCGGATEDAKEVWGRAIPYLRSVPCGFDRASPRYRTEVRLGLDECARRLGLHLSREVLTGKTPLSLHILGRTAAGRVACLEIAGRTFSGKKVRDALALRSTNFSIHQAGPHLSFTVLGYGHGVGLCQYGAQGMAHKGATYLQILQHYYTGVTLGKLRGSE